MTTIQTPSLPASSKSSTPAPASNSGTPAPGGSSSAWSRGPPSRSSSALPSGATSPIPHGIAGDGLVNGMAVASSSTGAPMPIAAGGGHSRKGSLMVGGGVDIKKGPLNFGTVDSPSTILSSSPAAPSTTGMHLTDNVKSFGSIEADATDPNAIKPPSRRTSTLVSPQPNGAPLPEKKKLDVHSMFGKPPSMAHDRRLSNSQPQSGFMNGGVAPGPGGGMMRPPQSPQAYNPQIQQGFRPQPQPMMANPSQQGQQPARQGGPNIMPQMQPGMQRPMMPPQYQNYPMMYQGGYYPGYNPYEQQYGMNPQWAPSQHPQNQYRPPPPQQPSPIPINAQLPSGSGGPSPVPTPPTRPPSLMTQQSSGPSTPSRPISMVPPTFTPQVGQPPSFSMSGGAASFTPRTTKAIKLTRPDGTTLDLKAVASVKTPESTPTPATESTVATPAAVAEPPKKKMPTLPTIVRIESEEQRKARMAEEALREKIRKEEEAEEKERKERKERIAREEQEAKVKAEAEKAAAEEKAKVEAEQKAKEEEEAKAKAAAAEEEERKVSAAKEETAKVEAEKASAESATQAAEQALKPEETNKALLTPSATPSPLASPRLGLPPKPASTHKPPQLEIKSSSSTPLSSARPIEDLQSIVYPGSYKPPSPGLNVDAKPGKFRYDREFLMQFMGVCKEKPEGLPNLDEIGLEAESSTSGFGRSRGPRSSVPNTRGGPPAGLGIGSIRPSASGMGSFGVGNFGSGSITRGTTSEERYNRSLRMARTPSQGAGLPGLHGLPAMSASTSRGGANRSQRGTRRLPQQQIDPDVAPLAISQNSWVKARPTDNDENQPAFIERKVKALLNKLTEEKFESISNQILEWANKSKDQTDGLSLKLVIKQVFEKATDEAHWSAMYAKLCRKILDLLDPAVTEEIDGKPVSGGALFRKYLIGRCQVDFEAGWKAREDAAAAAAAKSQGDKELLAQQEKDKAEGKEVGEAVFSDEYYLAQKAKRRGLGLVQLIGELYKLDMISRNVIKNCLQKLLGNIRTEHDEEDVESTCKLLTTIGAQYEQRQPDVIQVTFGMIDEILGEADEDATVLSSRSKFMLMDLKDLRNNGWVGRNKQAGVMTIAEIHRQAAREQAEKAAAQRESISRGGSRAGQPRQQAGEWQSVATNARPIARAADLSNLGRISSSGMSSAPTFSGPQSHFAKKKAGLAGTATPPGALSRNASTTNMFGVLNEPESAAAPEEPTRKKLQLAPRTVPVEGEGEGEGEEHGEESDEASEEEIVPATPSLGMSEHAAKIKIASDMKELWGEKDQGGSRNPDDIVEYFKALPDERRVLLAETLADEVFRISKLKDAEVVARGLAMTLEQGLASTEILKKGLVNHMPSLDDDAIDFPQAYKAMALLMRSLSLPQEEIDEMKGKIDVMGTPRITPSDKLDKALGQVDEEASK